MTGALSTTPHNSSALDIQTDGGAGTTTDLVSYPLEVTNENMTWLAYVYLPEGVLFKNRNGETSSYGWVKIESADSDCLTIMGPNNLWMSQVLLKVSQSTNHNFIYEYETSGVMRRDPGVAPELRALSKEDKFFVNKRLKELVVKGYSQYLKRIRRAPLVIEERIPTGRFKKPWFQTVEQPGVRLRTDAAKRSLRDLTSSLKNVMDIGSDLQEAKEGIFQYGNMESQDAETRFVDTKGNVIERKTPLIQWGGVRSIEYPFTKPNAFKLSKKRFNKLLETTPSTLLQPIKTWIDAIDDVEEYAVGMLISLYRMLNIFQK